MNPERLDSSRESRLEISSTPPAVESFLDPAHVTESWPSGIATNEEFLKQIETRKELNDNLDTVLDLFPRPDVSLEDAIRENNITEEQAAKLYSSLSGLLENDPNSSRLVLYLPFEFLPSVDWQPESEELEQAADRFRKTYMETWKGLLSVHDVRANFVDGDVLEIEQRVGDLPRVVKAAHLIPHLVEKGLLTTEDAILLMEESKDQTLKDSIAATMPVLADLGLLSETEILRLETSKDDFVQGVVRTLNLNVRPMNPESGILKEGITLVSVQEYLQAEIKAIDTKDRGGITEKRANWLIQKEKNEAVAKASHTIMSAIQKNTLPAEETASFLLPETDLASQQAFIEGIRQAVELTAGDDPAQARSLYEGHKEGLVGLWQQDTVGTHEVLAKTFSRLHGLDVIDDQELAELNIVIPTLEGPFSENLAAMQQELNDIRDALLAVESNPELSRLIYPIALIYGSRLKGYGTRNADVDIAVFVRPEATPDDRSNLRALLTKTFASEKIRGEVVEFWLEKKGEDFTVHDFDEPDVLLGESSWTHILFGGAWEGDKGTIRELREKLLVPYLYDTDKKIYEHPARAFYLEELERDTLQYRLMHKGYARFYPSYGGLKVPHADMIDGHSMFWDSGYRQLATKLFASRVFLPKITPRKGK